MKKTITRTICIKLDVSTHDAALTATRKAFNAAASWIARVCWDEGITNTNTAHHRVYGETRARFGLLAQLAVNARAKAVEAIKSVKAKKRETCPQCGARGSVRMDHHHIFAQRRIVLTLEKSRAFRVSGHMPTLSKHAGTSCGKCLKSGFC